LKASNKKTRTGCIKNTACFFEYNFLLKVFADFKGAFFKKRN